MLPIGPDDEISHILVERDVDSPLLVLPGLEVREQLLSKLVSHCADRLLFVRILEPSYGLLRLRSKVLDF